MDPYVVVASAVVGLLVGMTGAGGGALMTPMLVLLFSVKTATAISSDLVASLVIRPVGAAVHFARGTVNLRLVGWLSAGSVPASLGGAYVLRAVGETHETGQDLTVALGAALLLGAAAMTLRDALDRRATVVRLQPARDLVVRPLPSLAIGAFGGAVVAMTSVGAGSLMIVLLMFTYTRVSASQLVGTDLAQAIPLTAAAALGALLFGSISFGVTTAIVVGAVPAILVGSLLSSRVPDRYLRPALAAVVLGSGLRDVGMSFAATVWSTAAVAVVVGVALARAWQVRKTALAAG